MHGSRVGARFRVRVGLSVVVIALCAVAVGACNTMAGLGKDITYLGEKTEKAADR